MALIHKPGIPRNSTSWLLITFSVLNKCRFIQLGTLIWSPSTKMMCLLGIQKRTELKSGFNCCSVFIYAFPEFLLGLGEIKMTSTSLKHCKSRLCNSLTSLVSRQLFDHNQKWSDYRSSNGRHVNSDSKLQQSCTKKARKSYYLPKQTKTHKQSRKK